MTFLGLKQNHFCILKSCEETISLGIEFARQLKNPTVLYLFGDLGSGKTSFSKGFIHEKTKEPLSVITSPTFVYMNLYENEHNKVAHFDLYRLKSEKEFLSFGFDEVLLSPIFSLVEWPEIISKIDVPHIELKFSSVNGFRKVEWLGGELE